MTDKIFCRFCGAHLREGAKFCPNCGTIVTKPPTPAEPNGLWSYVQSLWGRFWATSATKQPYKIIAGAVVAILILMVLAAGTSTSNTVNQDSATKSTPLPSATPITKVTPTPKPTATPTPAPTPAVLTDAQKVENSLRSHGSVIVTPFKEIKTDLGDGYEGFVRSTSSGVYWDVAYFPHKTMSEATFDLGMWKSIYQRNGYTTVKDLADEWQGVRYSDGSTVDVSALPNSILNTPMVTVFVSK